MAYFLQQGLEASGNQIFKYVNLWRTFSIKSQQRPGKSTQLVRLRKLLKVIRLMSPLPQGYISSTNSWTEAVLAGGAAYQLQRCSFHVSSPMGKPFSDATVFESPVLLLVTPHSYSVSNCDMLTALLSKTQQKH